MKLFNKRRSGSAYLVGKMSNFIIPDKYEMKPEMARFLARKFLKESVYRSAHLEGMGVTFPQTEAIVDNLMVEGVAPREISKVCDLRDGWKFVLDNLEREVDLGFLEDLQAIVARDDVEWNELGKLRTVGVRITGTGFMPEVPRAEMVAGRLSELLANPHETDRAIEVGLFVMRSQLFLDGNKRVGTLAANRLLVATGRGIFSVPDTMAVEFSEKLVRFYETGESEEIKRFIFQECLTGAE